MIYQVYCDNHLIFDTRSEALKIINPQLELELNKTGSFTFTIYPSNPNFDKLKKLKSIIQVFQDDFLLFRGRILNDDQGFHNEKQVSCEGELAFLVDSIQRPYDFMSGTNYTTIEELFTFFIENHNAQVDIAHRFSVGTVTVTDPNNYIVRSDSTYMNTWDSIQKKLIEPCGGYLFVRHVDGVNYIDYLADFTTVSSQKVEFGKNLIDLNRITKGEDVATAIIPLGAKLEDSEERLTISSVHGGVDYVFDQAAVDQYGWIFKTAEFDDVTDPNNLLLKGNEVLASSINLLASIELSAVDLAALNTDINTFRLGTYINVVSQPQGLNSNFLVQKLSISLIDVTSNKLTLGKSYSTFTEQSSGTGSAYQIAISKMEDKYVHLQADVLRQTISTVDQSATQILQQVSEDYYLKSDADELVQSVNTQLAEIYEKLIPEDRISATLQNNWVNYGNGYESASYWKDSVGVVHLAGMIKSGATAAETVIFTLPEGYKPRANEKFFCLSLNEICVIDVYSSGDVAIKTGANSEWVSLSGIIFRIT